MTTPNPCAVYVIGTGTNRSATVAANAVAKTQHINIELRGLGERTVDIDEDIVGGGLCRPACEAYDEAWRRLVKAKFDITQRKPLAAHIERTIRYANKNAFNLALDTFLSPDNLPSGLRGALRKKIGGTLTLQAVKRKYESGELEGIYTIDNVNGLPEFPLFTYENEQRTHTYNRGTYSDSGLFPDLICIPSPYGDLPQFWLTSVKVVRGGGLPGYETSFFTGAAYASPVLDLIRDFNLIGRDADRMSATFGARRTDSEGADHQLLSPAEREGADGGWMMFTAALARPFGGKFPRSGSPAYSPAHTGEAGGGFRGSRLTGIADKHQTGDRRVINALTTREIALVKGGRTVDSRQTYAEDYLH